MNDQNKSSMRLWMIVAVRVLVPLVVCLAVLMMASEFAEKRAMSKISFRYVGQGTNNAGLLVSLFDVNGMTARNNVPSLEAIMLNKEGVPFPNQVQGKGAFARFVRNSEDPFRMTLQCPLLATTNAWQLHIHFVNESLFAKALGTVTPTPPVGKARGWPYDRKISTKVPPQSP